MLEVKLNVVNKKDYEEKHNYREVVIKLPKTDEELRKDFEYLGLDYDNLSIQDTHVKKIKFIEKETNTQFDEFCDRATIEIQDIINKGFELGYTAPYQDLKELYKTFRGMSLYERDKAISLIIMKNAGINCIKDVFDKLERIDDYAYCLGVGTAEGYLSKLVENNMITAKELIKHIDLKEVGESLLDDQEHIFSEYGLLVEDISMSDLEKKLSDEEEFE